MCVVNGSGVFSLARQRGSPDFIQDQSLWDFALGKVSLGQVSDQFDFPLPLSLRQCPIHILHSVTEGVCGLSKLQSS